MPITIYDVAKKAGVSVVTVSRVLNNSDKVRKTNRQKVNDAIKALNYKPNVVAQNLARGKKGLIGLVMPTINDSFMIGMLTSIEQELKKTGYFLVVSAPLIEDESEQENQLNIEDRVDGLIIINPSDNKHYLQKLKQKKCPFILIDQGQTYVDVPTLTIDHLYGAYQATHALIKTGAAKIAYISGNCSDRLDGYKKALIKNNIPFNPNLIAQGHFTVQGGYQAMENWIKVNYIPDAIFAANDLMAIGVMDACQKYNIKIPEDLSLIGYNNHPFSKSLHPRLSTVNLPTKEIGKMSVDLILKLIKNEVINQFTMTFKPQIILRDSTKS